MTGSPSVSKVAAGIGDEATTFLLPPILHDVEATSRGGCLAIAVSCLEYGTCANVVDTEVVTILCICVATTNLFGNLIGVAILVVESVCTVEARK